MNQTDRQGYLNRLEDNFREIYHAIKFSTEHHIPLVANFSGTRIYDSRCFWGRIWVWFYDFADFFSSYPWYTEKLQQAIRHTDDLFSRTLASVEPHLNNYEEYLIKSGKGYPFSATLCLQARIPINKWNDSTKPLIKLIQTAKPNHPIIKGFQTSFSAHAATIQSLQDYQKIIDLEGWCAAQMPLFALKRILRNIPLNSIDQKEISKWVAKLDKNSTPLKAVHQALQAIANFYATKRANERVIQNQLASLELFLEENGCKVFQQNDVKHLKWRQSLQTGNTVAINQTVIALGDEIFPTLSGSDQTRAYSIKEMPNHIALIAHNCSVLPLRNLRMQQKRNSLLPTACFTEISSNGKIALMERLKSPNELKWTSLNKMINEEDAPIVSGIAKLIQNLIQQNATPSNFASSIMFDANMQFKCIKPINMLPFDFNTVEDFIEECSCGNETIFQELMATSGLLNHPSAKFYKEIVSNTLNNDKMDANDLAAIYKISDSKIVDKSVLLVEQILTAKKSLLLELRKLHPNWHSEQLNTQANLEILKRYEEQKYCSNYN